MNNIISMEKINDLLHKEQKKDAKCKCMWIIAGVVAVIAIAAIAFGVYKYVSKNRYDEFDEDDFEDDFEDDIFEEESEA